MHARAHARMHPAQVPMVAPAKPGTAEQVVGPLTEQPQPHCTGLRLTDTHLWFWRTNTELMRMDVRASGPHAHAVLAATLQPPEGQKIPSWQLDPASWLVYYKVGPCSVRSAWLSRTLEASPPGPCACLALRSLAPHAQSAACSPSKAVVQQHACPFQPC